MRRVLVWVLIAGTLSLLCPNAQAAPPDFVRVNNYNGNAFLVRRGEDIELTFDTEVQRRDVVETEEGDLDLAVYDYAGIRLSRFTSCEMVGVEESKVIAHLNKGTVLVHADPPPSGGTLSIESDYATASVSGTKGAQFIVWVGEKNGKKTMTITMLIGRVFVRVNNSSATITIPEGGAVDVDESTYIPPVRSSTEEEKEALDKVHSVLIAV